MLVAPQVIQSAISINNGAKLSLTNSNAFNGGPQFGGLSTVSSLNISGNTTTGWTGLVDVGNAGIVVTGVSDSGATIRSQIIQVAKLTLGGTNSTPTWSGTGGITSSAAAASPSGSGNLAVGYYVSGSTVTVATVLDGDAYLQGLVDNRDLNLATLNLGKSGVGWQGGDFHYIGQVTTLDRSVVLNNLYNALPALAMGAKPAGQGIQPADETGTPTVNYDATSGLPTLNDSGSDYMADLDSVEVNLSSTALASLANSGDISGTGA